MRREFKLLGIVLKKKKLKEKDLQVILFTREKGRLSLLAKGVQKITSRRLSYLDTGNLIKARVVEKQVFLYLSETALVSGFSSIKEDYQKAANLFLVLKLVEKVLPEGQEERQLFNFLLETIRKIDREEFKKDSFLEGISKILGIDKKELEEDLSFY